MFLEHVLGDLVNPQSALGLSYQVIWGLSLCYLYQLR